MNQMNREKWDIDKTMEVKKILMLKKMTQEQLADEINCSRVYLNEVLNLKRVDPFIEMALDRWVREHR